jgi:hypothetical protein
MFYNTKKASTSLLKTNKHIRRKKSKRKICVLVNAIDTYNKTNSQEKTV